MSDGVEVQSEDQEDGFKQAISLGPQPHPITGELGIALMVGQGRTWLSFQEAQGLITNLQSVTFTALASTVFMGIISAQQQHNQQDGLIIPR